MSLRGWSEAQAQGLLDSLKLDGGTPNWKQEWLERLHDWCSTHERDSNTYRRPARLHRVRASELL